MNHPIIGVVTFFDTGDLRLIRSYYGELLGLPLRIARGGYELYDAFGNGMLGFGETDSFHLADHVLISFMVNSPKDVDHLFAKISGTGLPILQEPTKKELYGIYNFFSKDFEGRQVEFMYFFR